MAQVFDPYHAWLAIPPEGQPPNHYRLLGLPLYESNPVLIENAFQRLNAHIKGVATGPYQLVAQRMLAEAAAARACLGDRQQKAAYDQHLQHIAMSASGSAAARQQPLTPIVVQMPQAPAGPVDPSLPQPQELAASPASGPTARRAGGERPTKRRERIPQAVKVVLGGMAGLAIGYFLVYYITGQDVLGLLPSSAGPPLSQEKTEPSAGAKAENFSSKRPAPSPPSRPPQKPPKTTQSQPSIAAIQSPEPGHSASSDSAQAPSTPSTAAAPATGTTPGANNQPTVVVTTSGESPSASPAGNPRRLMNTAPLPGTAASPEPAAPLSAAATRASPKRLPPPSAAEQKKMLAELQTLYKDEFDRGLKPEGRAAFVGFLLSSARQLSSDPAAHFVLMREAYDRAIRLEDFVTAAEIIDELERSFEVDGFKLRLHLLTEAARRTLPDDRPARIDFSLEMAEYALATHNAEDAIKCINMAESQARSVQQRELKAHTLARCIELRKAAEGLAPVAAARKRLQIDPADAEASLVDGKHRCFVEGDWPAGLKLLAQSSHPGLSAAARADLAGDAGQGQALRIGDAWFDLGSAGDAHVGALARAEHWYKRALPGAGGLDKVKIEKRLEQIAAKNLPPRLSDPAAGGAALKLAAARYQLTRQQPFAATDLMAAITPQTIRTPGWYANTRYLRVDESAVRARLQSPVNPTGEYETSLRIRRYGASSSGQRLGAFVVGLPVAKSQFLVVLDYPIVGQGYASFLTLEGYKRLEDNPTFTLTQANAPRLAADREIALTCTVKLNEIRIALDGEPLIQYAGDMSKLTMMAEWSVPDRRSMFLGAHEGGFYINGWTVSPLTEEGGDASRLLPPASGTSLRE